MAGHTEGLKKVKFCSKRAEKCECGNKYRAPCEGEAAGWDAIAPGCSRYAAKLLTGAQTRSHEAHHVACVASVTGVITANASIDPIVRSTVWCVNVASNMIALPLWPHSIQWYVMMATGTLELDPVAPPFADVPQHDYDHGRYNKEVEDSLREIPGMAKKAAKKHKDPTGNLAGQLDAVVTKHRGELTGRSTHAAWLAGVAGDKDWYKAFSMSTSDPKERAFPLVGLNNRMSRKIAAVVRLFRML